MRRPLQRVVVEALPKRCAGLPPEAVDAMTDIARWGDVTLIVNTDSGIIAVPIAEGKVMRGYYNVMAKTAFHGHIRHKQCAAIAFVKTPLHGPGFGFPRFPQPRRQHLVLSRAR